MPQLKEDSTSDVLNGFDDSAPRLRWFGRMNSWSVDLPFAHGLNMRRLCHDESSRSTLRVVSRRKFAWYAISVCADAGHARLKKRFARTKDPS